MGGKGENGELSFNMYGVSVWDDENFLEMGGSNGDRAMRIFNTTEMVYLKMIKMIKSSKPVLSTFVSIEGIKNKLQFIMAIMSSIFFFGGGVSSKKSCRSS